MQQMIQKYQAIAQKYHCEIQITIDENLLKKIKIDEVNHTLICNPNLIANDQLETYIAYGVRELVFNEIVIENNDILLRHPMIEDLHDIYEIIHDRDTCYLDGGYEPYETIEDAKEVVQKYLLDDKYRFVVYSKKYQKTIGLIHLMNDDKRVVECFEIGYLVNQEYRRQHFAYQSVRQIIQVLFDDFHVDMISAGCIARNEASIGVLKKLGFTFEGTRKKSFYHPIYGVLDLQYYILENN